MRRLLLVAVLGLGLAPAGADGQSQAFRDQVDEATLTALTPVLTAAARDSLPLAALEAKALEGKVKGYPTEVIVSALERMADDFRQTRASLLGELPGRGIAEGEIVAASLARSRGVSASLLGGLMADTEAGSMHIPVTVLGELVRQGLPVDDAVWVIDHVLAEGIPLSQVTRIPGRFDLAARNGAGGRGAAVQALQSLGISPPAPRRPSGPGGPGRPSGH